MKIDDLERQIQDAVNKKCKEISYELENSISKKYDNLAKDNINIHEWVREE